MMPTSSHLSMANKSIVIDCGLGVTSGLVNAGYKLTEITHIFITHYHSDHCLELGALLHTAWTAGLSKPIKVYGPPGLSSLWNGFREMMKFDIDIRIKDEGRPPLDDIAEFYIYSSSNEVNESFNVMNDGELDVSAIKNNHPPIDESYALRFDINGKAITFSGDTSFLKEMIDFANDSDVLVHEAMLSSGVDYVVAQTKTGNERLRKHLMASHTLASQAGTIAKSANVKCLMLNHLIPPEREISSENDWLTDVKNTYDGQCLIGFDGLKYSI
ncbi:MBL fold metallo-hydrolase [Alphaproteobacteria bacterium]|nr:MBL fold metallo-hydrolase [Alphaproteobacteria bacterium]